MKRPYIPTKVEVMDARYYAASYSRDSIDGLAHQLLAIPEPRIPVVIAAINGMGLMVPPLWLRAMVRVLTWFKGLAPISIWFIILSSKDPRLQPLAPALLVQVADHMRKGKDREDARSVGGFSQRELNAIGNILAVAYHPDNHALEKYVFAAHYPIHGEVL